MCQASLSVCILFYEKLDQTIECVSSFLPSRRPIYVLNNGSSANTANRFALWCKAYPQIKFFETCENLGVSGGRNLLIRESNEQWLFFIDNDIVVNTPDWSERFARHLNRGMDVLIPRLLNRHEGRYVEPRKIEVTGNKAFLTAVGEKETNSFPGGAALINRKLFERLGNYDKEIFVGGEDFELALRGILSGRPIRVLAVPDVELIHDHQQMTDAQDVQAVLTRYDKARIQKSYQRIEEKHGVRLDDGWEGWVDQQVRQQVPCTTMKSHNPTGDIGCRPRIALVSDVRDWAFHNIATSIKNNLGDRYDFDIFYLNEYFPDLTSAARDLFTESYDLVHFLSREGLPLLFNHLWRRMEGVTDDIIAGFINTPFTFSIYSHCKLSPSELGHAKVIFNYLAKGYTVSSFRLDGVYRRLKNFVPPTKVIEDGVDPELFYPCNLERLANNDRQLVVGWAGNSNWGRHVNGLDHKGLHTLIKPAIASLQVEGLSVIGHFCDSSEHYTAYQDMAHYYNTLDIYVCASDMEGTPNPVLEAMACGLPIVSTDVGIVPELFGPLQQELIVKERSVTAIQDRIRLLLTDPVLRMALSKENIDSVADWTRQAESLKWRDFFERFITSKEGREPEDSAYPGGKTMKRLCLDFPHDFMFAEAVNVYLADSLSWKITAPIRKVHYHFNCWFQNYQQKRASRNNAGDVGG